MLLSQQCFLNNEGGSGKGILTGAGYIVLNYEVFHTIVEADFKVDKSGLHWTWIFLELLYPVVFKNCMPLLLILLLPPLSCVILILPTTSVPMKVLFKDKTFGTGRSLLLLCYQSLQNLQDYVLALRYFHQNAKYVVGEILLQML